ncbi:MAG: 23S rRNA pseudouridylate synthase [Gammaproteobacteria bacterium RIFCSPHIGHO2_12_FULL_42_10]|nr:MAG: 23S rRNA pseudouridylate synthase [Gammaproteobacteria bacterium RIFCSPHIGHO2_12_FULL_42_10]
MLTSINHTFIVPDTLIDLRLDQALSTLMSDYSRTQIKLWITEGLILVDQKPVKPKYKVKAGETITVNASPKPELTWEAQPIPLNIVYEDEILIVINKPMGLVVHPGAGHKNTTLLNALLHHEPALRTLPRAGILHRLDKDTSGLLLIAKTDNAYRHLTYQLKKRTLLREYQAIVYGTLISGGTVRAPIARHYRERTRMAVIETGKEAITHYRISERYRAHTRLLLRLETGRTHQIRVHLAYINRPVVGDPTYGGRMKIARGITPPLIQALRQFKRQALHAYAVGFTHPVTREWMRFESELPDDIQQLITTLREDNKVR